MKSKLFTAILCTSLVPFFAGCGDDSSDTNKDTKDPSGSTPTDPGKKDECKADNQYLKDNKCETCNAGTHVNRDKNGCEENKDDDCGSAHKNCTSIEHTKTASCKKDEGVCEFTCEDDYDPSADGCTLKTSNGSEDECTKDDDCMKDNVIIATCELAGGIHKCKVTACEQGFKPSADNSTCAPECDGGKTSIVELNTCLECVTKDYDENLCDAGCAEASHSSDEKCILGKIHFTSAQSDSSIQFNNLVYVRDDIKLSGTLTKTIHFPKLEYIRDLTLSNDNNCSLKDAVSMNFDALTGIKGSVILNKVCAENAGFPKLKSIPGDLELKNVNVRNGLNFNVLESIMGSFYVSSSNVKVNTIKYIAPVLQGTTFKLLYNDMNMDSTDFDNLTVLGSESVEIISNKNVSFKLLKEIKELHLYENDAVSFDELTRIKGRFKIQYVNTSSAELLSYHGQTISMPKVEQVDYKMEFDNIQRVNSTGDPAIRFEHLKTVANYASGEGMVLSRLSNFTKSGTCENHEMDPNNSVKTIDLPELTYTTGLTITGAQNLESIDLRELKIVGVDEGYQLNDFVLDGAYQDAQGNSAPQCAVNTSLKSLSLPKLTKAKDFVVSNMEALETIDLPEVTQLDSLTITCPANAKLSAINIPKLTATNHPTIKTVNCFNLTAEKCNVGMNQCIFETSE